MREQAKLDALPATEGLVEQIAAYDAKLLADARAIYDRYTNKDRFSGKPLASISDLRPHYKALMEAYTAEYIDNAGLSDQTIIDFFDNYVHDSLSGFAKDATVPSDPRVVYLGGDEKYRYALRSRTSEEEG